MKKINKIFLTALSIAASAFMFTACFDPLYYDIRQEVKLEDPTVVGQIYSLVRFNDRIYLSNGKIYSKPQSGSSHGQWTQDSKPSGFVITLAADKDYLYALAAQTERNDTEGEMEYGSRKIYCSKDGSSWTQVNISLNAKSNTVAQLMCTNTVNKASREAYLNYDDTVYKLNGTSASQTSEKKIYSCAKLNGETKFFSGRAACSTYNEDAIYYSDGTTLKKVDATGSKTICSGVKGKIYGIAVMDGSVFINTTSGAALVARDSGSELKFANLSSTLSGLYEGYCVLAADPSRTAFETPIYASILVEGTGSNSALFTHEGLWAYYPDRDKWNIE